MRDWAWRVSYERDSDVIFGFDAGSMHSIHEDTQMTWLIYTVQGSVSFDLSHIVFEKY